MNEHLLIINLTYLLVATLFLILFVLMRECIRYFKKLKWKKNKRECLALIGQVENLKSEEILSLTIELKKLFSIELVESVLDDCSSNTSDHAKFADIYDHLGLMEKHLKTLKEAKAWMERANAAERLGQIGHAKAVLPLIEVIQDPLEDREVKNIAIEALGKIQDERAIPYLIKGLGLPNQTASQLLADILARFGEKALDPIIKTISTSSQETQRFWGVHILGRSKNRKVISALKNALSDHIAKVRGEAAKGLGNIGARDAVSSLCKVFLEDPNSLVRDSCAEALGAIADERSLSTLIAGFSDLDIETRRRSMEAMEKMGEKAIPFLLDALKNGPEEAKIQAASALERMGLVAAEIERLDGPEEKEAFENLRFIAKTGVVETLIRSLNHLNLKIRISLCHILENIPHNRTLEALSEMAQKDKELTGRIEALSALAKLADKRSIPILKQALQTGEEVVQERLLAAIQEAPLYLLKELWEEISLLLHADKISIRILAADVLFRLSLPCLVPIFLDSLSDSSWEIRKKAAEALGKLQGDNVILPLIEALKDHSVEVRIAAIKSLGWIKNPQAIEPLAQSFEWADENARYHIATALAATSENLLALTDLMMGLTNPKAKAGVVWTLGLTGDQKAIPLIQKFLEDPDPTVRAAAVTSFGLIGSFSNEIRASLIEGLKDPNERVRASVVKVLGQFSDSSLIEMLLSMLAKEPDEIVCQSIVLAIGCLNGIVKHPEAVSSIKTWLGKTSSENSQAAGFISLALLEDESSFQTIFSTIQNSSLLALIKKSLNELSKENQDRFYSFLSLDSQLFQPNQIEKSWEHYKDILRSAREANQRIHAIHALVLLKEKSALPLIESTFAKDPNPKVRGEALKAMEALLESHQMINKITEAILDPSPEIRSDIVTILQHLNPKEFVESREKLIPLLDSHEEIRRAVSKLLAHLYRQDWHLLTDQLIGTNKKSRMIGLIETLAEIGDSKSSLFFLKFMRHKDLEVRSITAEMAFKMHLLSRKDWFDFLKDPQELVRLYAIREIGRQLDSEAIEILSLHIQDPSSQIRKEIAKLLGKQKSQERERQMKLLQQLSGDVDPIVQILSFLSLFRLGEKGISKEITALVANLSKNELDSLLSDLEKEEFLSHLILSLHHEHDMMSRIEAIEILASLDLFHYSHAISNSLKDPAREVRLTAIKVLDQLEEPFIQQAIENLSQDPIEEIRVLVKNRQLKKGKS